MIEIYVPAIPVAQPRQRHAVIGGQVRNYTPASHPVQAFKATLRLAAVGAYSGPPLDGPLGAEIVLVFPAKKKSRTPKATKPDCDNLAKGVLDALNGLLYRDDGQVAELTVRKWHAGKDEQTHVSVKIWKL